MKTSLAFDTETTGLLKPNATQIHLQPYLTEIYIAKIDENCNVVDEFETLVRPMNGDNVIPIPEEITKITGISADTLKNAPCFDEIYLDLCNFVLGSEVIYAQNASFDIGVLANELSRRDLLLKFPWPRAHKCTVELSMPIKNKRIALGDLHKMATGCVLEKAHRAKSDVLGMIRCIKWLREKKLDSI